MNGSRYVRASPGRVNAERWAASRRGRDRARPRSLTLLQGELVAQLRWRTAFTFMTHAPAWKRHLFLGGFLLLLCPPVGWPLALGYRREVARRLVEGQEPVLPNWRSWAVYLRDGLKAVGVILTYYIPFLAIFWCVALPHPEVAVEHWVEIAVFLLLVLLLIPIFLPLLPVLYGMVFPWMHLSPAGAVVAGAVFWGTAFLLPAAFLQVSVDGSFRAAFRLHRAIGLIG